MMIWKDLPSLESIEIGMNTLDFKSDTVLELIRTFLNEEDG